MGGVINNPPFINTFHNPSASLVGTIVTIYEIGCCAGRQYHHSACRRTSRSTKVHLYRRVHHPRWDGSEGGSCLALAWYVKGLWLMRRSLGPDLLTGLPQLDQPSPPIRSLAKSRSRSIRLLPALLSQLRHHARLLGRIREFLPQLFSTLCPDRSQGFTSVSGSKGWRIPVDLQAIFIVPIMILVFIVPESPRWLASHGRSEDSLATIARLRGRPIDDLEVVATHNDIMVCSSIKLASPVMLIICGT